MIMLSTCRFCDNWQDQNMVRYATRHSAHYKCYLDKGKKLSDLRPWQVSMFPYYLLKERGLLEEARKLAGNENPISGEHNMKLWDIKDAKVIAQTIENIAPKNIMQRAELIVEAARIAGVNWDNLIDACQPKFEPLAPGELEKIIRGK